MKYLALLVLFLALSLPATSFADTVVCESRNNQRAECDMDTRGNVRLVENLSKTRCVEGQNWGLFKHSVWVDKGCRAKFVSDGGGSNQSNNYQSGGGYSSSSDRLDSLPTRVTCESMNNRRTDCDMDTRGRVMLVENLSKTRCVEGQNWGMAKHSIWVDKGCRARFESDGGSNNQGSSQHSQSSRPTNAQVSACNAVEDWYGEMLEFTALKPGAWEIILDYGPDGRYVCNVEANGRVTYFERLNNQ